MPDEKIDHKRPVQAETEPKKEQQRHVDDTVDDSFPASDPPAWTTTGAKSVAATCEPDSMPPSEAEQHGSAASQFAQRATHMARDVYERSQRYIDEGRRRYPEVDRYSRMGMRAVSRPVREYPLAALLGAAAAGYLLASLVHARSGARPQKRHSLAQDHGEWEYSGDSPKPHGDKYAGAVDRAAQHDAR